MSPAVWESPLCFTGKSIPRGGEQRENKSETVLNKYLALSATPDKNQLIQFFFSKSRGKEFPAKITNGKRQVPVSNTVFNKVFARIIVVLVS